jgi:transcriptional regulator with XRE-family HTH domain
MTKRKKPAATEDALAYFQRTTGSLTLGRALAAIRDAEEVSLAAFAKRLRISRAYLCDVEQGRRGVSPEKAAAWARALGQPAQVFVALALQDSVRAAGLKFRVSVEAA